MEPLLEIAIPKTGSVVRVRCRHWLVASTTRGLDAGDAALVSLRCLDDDAAGEILDVLWEHELDAEPETSGQIRIGDRLEDPRIFGAWLLALRWNCVTATDKDLFQAPFRAGIQIKPYQLEPLRKALALPRVNLFIADDVGLGKTIEAGLVLQELLLRQRVDRVLVVCPPAITLQWKEELEQRFGLGFAIYDREWIAARRRERGWAINPWDTHPRFIVSYNMLRGSERTGGEHLEMLVRSLGDRASRSLLILDEVHQVAPASGGIYATDTRTTQAIRQIVSRFEHRLFLSATPHNGHSNSFSTLLEMLDPQRFTRGVPITGADELEPIMVRRLKRDLRLIDGKLPERVLCEHDVALGPKAPEVELGLQLLQYETLYRQALVAEGVRDVDARSLICVNLHKRLLSSIVAFARTLDVHARAAAKLPRRQAPLPLRPPAPDDEATPEQLAEAEDAWVSAASFNPGDDARVLLASMQRLAERHREEPDGRLRAFADWVRAHCWAAGRWNERRVIVFTEYEDTLSWMARLLPSLLPSGADDRIGRYTGRMSDESRQALKDAFNIDPARHPLRILLCTDAAREGINLQAHCHDVFHFDLPWNPARIEQRNGRIDRTLQPESKVYCHYFVLPDRPEDRVLAFMRRKIDTIRAELGSFPDVLSERFTARLEQGIRRLDEAEVDRLLPLERAATEAVSALEQRCRGELLRDEVAAVQRLLTGSQGQMGFREEHLRQVVQAGLERVSLDHTGLHPVRGSTPPSFALPPLDGSWAALLDPMRDEEGGERAPLRPITFSASDRMDAPAIQLHLAHPLVRRLLQRFLAPGWSKHDLARVTLVATEDRLRRVIAFSRLVLFGHGAARLHEEILVASGQILADGTFRSFADAGTERSLRELADRLAAGTPLHPHRDVQRQVLARAKQDFVALAGELDARFEVVGAAATRALMDRAVEEQEAMRGILRRQEAGIRGTKARAVQERIRFDRAVAAEREQFERDVKFMDLRLGKIQEELGSEPEAIGRSYEVVLPRHEHLGLLYLWPGA